MSDNQAETAALELDELKALCAELCDLYDKWAVGNESGYGLDAREAARCMDLADGIGHHVPALVAEVERLRAQTKVLGQALQADAQKDKDALFLAAELDEARAQMGLLRAQRDEVLAFALAGNDPSLTLQQIVRVLSRTEDTAQHCEECREFYQGKPTYKHDLELGCADDCPCKHNHRREVASDPLAQARAEVQRLTAELALKDQALDEIKALAQEMRAQAVMIRAGKTSMKSLRAVLREAAANDIQRVLTRLDTQGETKQ